MFGGGPRGLLEQEVRKPKSVSATLARLGQYFRKYTLALIAVAVLLIASTWAQVTVPQLIGQATDCYITPAALNTLEGPAAALAPANGQASVDSAAQTNCWWAEVPANASTAVLIAGLGRLTLVIIALFVMVSAFSGLQFYLMTWSGQHVLRQLREDVFAHLHTLSLGYYGTHEAGAVMSRVTNDTDTVQQAISFALIQVLSGVLLLVWIGYKMLALNWAYALLSMAVIPSMLIATVWFSNQARKAFRRTREEIGNVNANLQESIAGVREAQAFSREGANIENFRVSNAANRDANIRAVAYTSALGPALEALGYVAIAVAIGVGGLLMLRGQSIGGQVVSLGLIVTFLAYVQRFNQPIQQIAVMWSNVQSAIAGAERIFILLDEQSEIVEKPNALVMPAIAGAVEFVDVHSEYDVGEPVLRGVSLKAEPGQTVAIVGPTGAGKTTIINLIPRFWDVTKGAIKIDGIDVRDVNLASLRQQIGIVLQDTFLFGDTVMNNIRFGRPEASDEEVMAAAKIARADTFIQGLADGYNTLLGERGSGLSAGQRQLLAIARAALINPRILILDEATSSVDTRTERQIQAALEEIMTGRTTFVIAHRLSTIRHADQLLVLDQGQIVERGTHAELLARKGFYYNLYMSQFSREEETPAISGNGRQQAATLPTGA